MERTPKRSQPSSGSNGPTISGEREKKDERKKKQGGRRETATKREKQQGGRQVATQRIEKKFGGRLKKSGHKELRRKRRNTGNGKTGPTKA